MTSPDGLWGQSRRVLTAGLVLTITLVAFESLAVATVMPRVLDDIGGLDLYGWVFSGFFLAGVVGIVAAGLLADRAGLVLPFAGGVALFTAGLVVGGLAPSMEVLVAGRVMQGLGAGAVSPTAYAAIARGYPAGLRPRMFATLSTAWVVPGLVGPAIAAAVEHATSWRFVFLGLVPFVVVSAGMIVRALAGLGSPQPATNPVPDLAKGGHRGAGPLLRALVLAVGAGAVVAASGGTAPWRAVVLVAVGAPAAVWAFVGLVPTGTLRLRPGVPATVALRGILTAAFFSADAFLPLMLVDGRGAETWLGGLALTACAVAWSAGSWLQAGRIERVGPRRLDRVGLSVIAAAACGLVVVAQGAWVGLAVLAWALGGFGIGLAYAPLSVTVLAAARPGEEGAASAALQLTDTLGIALGTGAAGAVVAFADGRGWAVADSTTVVFCLAILLASLGCLAAGRLPDRLPAGPGGDGGAPSLLA